MYTDRSQTCRTEQLIAGALALYRRQNPTKPLQPPSTPSSVLLGMNMFTGTLPPVAVCGVIYPRDIAPQTAITGDGLVFTYTLSVDTVITACQTLVVPDDVIFIINSTLTNNGQITIFGVMEVDDSLEVINNASINVMLEGTLDGNITNVGDGTYANQNEL